MMFLKSLKGIHLVPKDFKEQLMQVLNFKIKLDLVPALEYPYIKQIIRNMLKLINYVKKSSKKVREIVYSINTYPKHQLEHTDEDEQ